MFPGNWTTASKEVGNPSSVLRYRKAMIGHLWAEEAQGCFWQRVEPVTSIRSVQTCKSTEEKLCTLGM